MNYQLIKNPFSDQICMIKRLNDNTFIPMDTSNTDYQEYLKWVAEGNTPQPAE